MIQTFINFVYTLSLVIWIGSIIFFSFFAAPAVFKTLDKEKAGELVGVIFPKYYLVGYICGFLALLTLLLSVESAMDVRVLFLAVMLACTLFAGMVVGPKARALKAKIKSESEEEKKNSLKSKFDSLHSLSVKLNGSVLLMGLVLLWFTAVGLKL